MSYILSPNIPISLKMIAQNEWICQPLTSVLKERRDIFKVSSRLNYYFVISKFIG